MKKKLFIIILIAAIVCVLVALALLFWNYTKLPNGSAEISGNIVDNDWNNFKSFGNGTLLRIEDKLYYNYERNDWNYGVYEICNSGSKRIISNGRGLPAEVLSPHFSIRKVNGELLLYNIDTDETLVYSESENDFFTSAKINSDRDMQSLYFVEKDDAFYYIKDYETLTVLGCDGNNDALVENVADFGFDIIGDEIFFVKDDGWLTAYNISSATMRNVCKLKGLLYSATLYSGSYLVYESCVGGKDGIYAVKFTDENPEHKLICAETAKIKSKTFSDGSGYDFTKWNINSFNVYDGKAYFALRSGLICHDLETDEEVVLSEKNVEECYIVDDMWIYFVDNHKTLWRVTQDGKTTERVFG